MTASAPIGREQLRASGFAPPALTSAVDGLDELTVLPARHAPTAGRARRRSRTLSGPRSAGASTTATPAGSRSSSSRRSEIRGSGSHRLTRGGARRGTLRGPMAIDSDEIRSAATDLLNAGAPQDPLAAMRHSAAHMLAAAVMEMFPDAKLGVGPPIKDGFYYDLDLPRAADPGRPRGDRAADARPASPPTCASSAPSRRAPRRSRSSRPARPAVQGRDHPRPAAAEGDIVTFYRHGTFEDLAAAGTSTAPAGSGAFKLLNVAGAYWRGDEHRADAAAHLWHGLGRPGRARCVPLAVEEAKKRDHRRLGRELDLFSFHPESPAAPVLAPARAWRSGARSRPGPARSARSGGFDEVRTPAVVRKELWETSGHWGHYQDNMFVLDDSDHVSGLKPMNCPESMLIYQTAARSYRDLPMRLADYSLALPQGAHRRAGGHVPGAAADAGRRPRPLPRRPGDRRDRPRPRLVRRQYAPFGFEPTFKLATRPEKRLGSDEFWDMAEGKLAAALRASAIALRARPRWRRVLRAEDRRLHRGRPGPGVADGHRPARLPASAALRPGVPRCRWRRSRARWWSTTRSTGSSSASSASSTEHFAGAFPLWLAPIQVMIVPIADRHARLRGTGPRRARRGRAAGRGRRPLGAHAGQAA